MTNLSLIDELALPSELARQRRLDPADWLLREVQIVWPSRGDLLDPFPIEMVLGPPQLSAVLQPRNVQAIKQFNTIWGQCFLAGGYLWRIGNGELRVDAGGLGTVAIECHAIWQQPSESRRVETCPVLPE